MLVPARDQYVVLVPARDSAGWGPRVLGMVILHDRRFAHAPVSRGSWDRVYFRDFRDEIPLNGDGVRLVLYSPAPRGTSRGQSVWAAHGP